MSAFDPSAPGLPIVGGGGASLPTTPADALLDAGNPLKLVYLDAGGAGDAISFEDASETGTTDLLSTLAGGTPAAGSYLSADGAGGLQLSSAASGGLTVTTYYASDFVAVNGSDTAAISGTGSTSTIVLTAGTAARTYGTAGVTAPHAILALPAGTRLVEIEIQIVSVTGPFTSGFRYLTAAVQNAASGIPTALWGVSWPDTPVVYGGSLLTGGNGGVNQGALSAHLLSANRWGRATLALTEARLAVLTGTGGVGTRPSVWAAPGSVTTISSAYGSIPDTEAALWLVIVLQPFNNAGANVVTLRPTIRVTQ